MSKGRDREMKARTSRRALPALVAATLLIGGAGAAHAHAASPGRGRLVTETIALTSRARNGIGGQATFVYNAHTNATTVIIFVAHLKSGSVHPALLRSGVCGGTGHAVAGVRMLRATVRGHALAQIVFPGGFDGRALNVAVYQGPKVATKIILCGGL